MPDAVAGVLATRGSGVRDILTPQATRASTHVAAKWTISPTPADASIAESESHASPASRSDMCPNAAGGRTSAISCSHPSCQSTMPVSISTDNAAARAPRTARSKRNALCVNRAFRSSKVSLTRSTLRSSLRRLSIRCAASRCTLDTMARERRSSTTPTTPDAMIHAARHTSHCHSLMPHPRTFSSPSEAPRAEHATAHCPRQR